MIGLLLGFVVLLMPFTTAMAEGDHYNGHVVSPHWTDSTKVINGSPYTEGLDDVDGITWAKENFPTEVNALNDRVKKDKQLIEKMVQAKAKLQEERDKANLIASQWKITAGKVAMSNGPDSINYNKWRLTFIDAMRVNVDVKIRVLDWDMATAVKNIADLNLAAVIASGGSQDQIRQAQVEFDQALTDLKITRKNLQKELADIKALNDASCWPADSLTPKIGNCILIGTGWVGNIITWVFALLLWVSSKIFDLSVYTSIILIKSWFGAPAVANVWRILRDLANLCFIFVLLYIALGTVFELSGMSDPKKMIVNVIVIALLVNFSGFFTRVIIDASNVIAYEFYSSPQMGGTGLGMKTIGTELVKKMDLGEYFISASTLAEANSGANKHVEPPQINRLSFLGIIAQTFGNIIIILVTSFVLLAAAILFLIRTIYLLFLYIFSPVAFVSMTIPKFDYFGKWRDKLISQAFFAPAFLIPLYVVFILLDKGIVSLTGSTGGFAAGSLSLVMIDAIIIGLLFGCIMIATKFGAAGAGVAKSWGKSLGWGALGMAGAHTIGRAANRIGRSDVMRNFTANNPRLGRLVNYATSSVAGSKFGTGAKAGGFTQRTMARQTSQQVTITGFTGPEGTRRRVEFLSHLNQRDRDVGYAKLSATERSAVNRYLEDPTTGAPYGGVVEATRLTASLSTSAGAATQRETQREAASARSQELLNNLGPIDPTNGRPIPITQANATTVGAPVNPLDITNISPEMIVSLPPAYLARRDIAPFLNIPQLDAMRQNTSPINATERMAIRNMIETVIAAAPMPLPPDLLRLQNWFNGPGAGF